MRSDITITRGKLSEGPGPLFLDRTWLPVIKLFHCLIITIVGTQHAALPFPKYYADRKKGSVENTCFWTLSLAIRKPEGHSPSHEPQRDRRQVLCLRQASRAAYVATAGGGN